MGTGYPYTLYREEFYMQKVIYINDYLSSSEFYGSLLPEIQIVLKYYDKVDELILDFSGTNRVEPNVIPNFLCLGKVIKSLLGYKAIIRIPDTYEGGKLKNYLYQMEFLSLAKESFDFESDPYTGFDGKAIDPLCGTVYFSQETSDDEIGFVFDNMVNPFADRYLKKYNILRLDNGQIENNVINLLKELAANAKEHGKSYSYTSIHAKYSLNTIFIAISDSGMGFFKSCIEEHLAEIKQSGLDIHNEVAAIMYCIYIRKTSKKFGLYAVIKDTINSGGTVRIHSNNSQLIFTPRTIKKFEDGTLLDDNSFKKYNIKSGLKFSGTHIEIEVPF